MQFYYNDTLWTIKFSTSILFKKMLINFEISANLPNLLPGTYSWVAGYARPVATQNAAADLIPLSLWKRN